MGNFSLTLVLFSSLCWASGSGFEFHTLVVQPSEEVTLWCSNRSDFPAHIYWVKLVDGSNGSRISSIISSESNATFREGFQNGKFTVTSNRTNVFLNIKQLDSSDSGLYVCGKSTDLKKYVFTATFLQVKDDVFVEPFWIPCAASIFLLIIVICLVATIRRLHKAQTDSQNPQQNTNPDSDALNYAALNFYPKAKRNRMAEAEKELETTVVYAATR